MSVSAILLLLVPLIWGCNTNRQFVLWKTLHWEKVESLPKNAEKSSSYLYGDFFGKKDILVKDPANSDIMLLQTSSYCIKRSEDAGKTWTTVLYPLNYGPFIVSKDGRVIYYIDSICTGATYFAFPYRSLDFGKTWQRLPLPPLTLRPDLSDTFTVSPDNPNVLYAITRSGIFKTAPGSGAYEYCPVTDGANAPYIYIGSDGVVYVSLLNYRSESPSASPYISSSATFKSVDFGKTWHKIGNFYFNPHFPDIYLKIRHDNVRSASTYEKTPAIAFYTSLDNGKSFVPSHFDPPESRIYSVAIGKDGAIYADTFSGLFKSTDNGLNFLRIANADKVHNRGSLEGNSCLNSTIAVGLQNPDVIYWATQFMKSVDGGKTWKKMRNVHGSAIAINPNDSNVLYAGIADFPQAEPEPSSRKKSSYPPTYEGLYKSVDSGKTWQRIGNSTFKYIWLNNDPISAIAISPKTGIVYVGTYNNGMFMSKDSGKTWQRIPLDNDFHLSVSSIAIDSENSIVYIGVLGGGIFKIKDGK